MANLLQLKNGKKSYGPRVLFEDASFSIDVDEKVGVIGPNGAGKSTLFRALVGEESLDTGEITKASGLRIGYLAQDDKWENDATVEAFLSSQTMTPIWDLKRLAPSFGLSLDHFDKPIRSLSGGYRMRVKLLYLVASQPDLMMLDEPTNYLDLETLVVLENFLQNTKSAFLLISHDREFLRRTTDHILEVEGGQMTKYAGQIDDYFEQKALLHEQLSRAAQSAQAKRNEILEFAARFGAKATKARQVQSRLKGLDRIETIEVRALPTTARIRLPEPVRTGKAVVTIHDAELGYGDRVILKGLKLELGKGDHLGVVGVNGAGKSTLLKALAGELQPKTGSVELGLNVEIAYFAQHVAERLEADDTVLEAMGTFAHPDVKRQEILDLAGCLLFSGDDVKKKIRVLSGGEKSRVALGQILLKRASCLLLDEPTNHLDFHTVEALTQALAGYAGTVVIVSHDRGFVRRTASKILEIHDGRAEFYPGSYDEYVWSVQKGVLSQRDLTSSGSDSKAQKNKSGADENADEQIKFNYKEVKKSIEKTLRAAEREMVAIDVEMDALKNRMLELNDKLLASQGVEATRFAREIGEAHAKMEALESRYMECFETQDSTSRELEKLLEGIENRRT